MLLVTRLLTILTIILQKIIHAGISNNDLNNYKFKILLSKRIDTSNALMYSLSIGKVFENFTTSFFINGMKSENIGLRIIYDI